LTWFRNEEARGADAESAQHVKIAPGSTRKLFRASVSVDAQGIPQAELACNQYTTQDECSDECFWIDNECRGWIDNVVVGGESHTVAKVNPNGRVKVGRPEFLTTQRFNTETNEWEPCSGDTNCFGSTEPQAINGSITNSNYSKIAIELSIKCAVKASLLTRFYCNNGDPSFHNMEISAWYNHAPFNVFKHGCGGAIKQWVGLPVTVRSIPIAPHDANPVLRIEMSAKNADERAEAAFDLRVQNVPVVFADCMSLKTHHGQCLRVMAGTDVPLRSNHTLQLKCLRTNINNTERQAAIDPACPEWRGCLGNGPPRNVLIKVLKAFHTLGSPVETSLGEKTDIETRREDKSQHLTKALVHRGSCNPMDHSTCTDPETFDVEAFDCNCFDELKVMSKEDIHSWACNSTDVCCDWKRDKCPAEFLEEARDRNDGEVSVRRLDDTMQSKCA
jgi:hypothetical protein